MFSFMQLVQKNLFFLCLLLLAACFPKRPSIRLPSSTHRYKPAVSRPHTVSAAQKSAIFSAPIFVSQTARGALPAAAASLVGYSQVPSIKGETYHQDCSGTARAIYAIAGVPLAFAATELPSDTAWLYELVKQNGLIKQNGPLPGDLIFFSNTYDRNADGKLNDRLTHVGVVEKILPDHTVIFVHYLGRSIVRSRMNLDYPQLQMDPKTKQRLNHILRKKYKNQKSFTTAELFAGFGQFNAPQ